MHFGMPTLIEQDNLEDTAILCEQLGLQFIELNMNFPNYQIENLEKIDYLLDIKKRYGIYYTIHLEENLNVSDFNLSVTKAYCDTVRRTISVAKKLHVPIINMHLHSGIYITLPTRKVYLYDQHQEIYLKQMENFRKMCEEEIADDNIMISIENTDGYLPFQKKAIELLLQSRIFSLTLDIGHSYCAKGVDEEFILSMGDRLKHFHIHDAKDNKNHLTLGTGEIDIPKWLTHAEKRHSRCVLETKTVEALTKSVHWLKGSNGNLLSDPHPLSYNLL